MGESALCRDGRRRRPPTPRLAPKCRSAHDAGHHGRVEVVLDGEALATVADVHRVLDEALDFGEFYGWNIAALRDRLLTDIPRPVQVTWLNSRVSEQRLGADFHAVVQVFEEVTQQDSDFGWSDRFEFSLE